MKVGYNQLHPSCASTSCPVTDETGVSESLPQSEDVYVPRPQVEGPASSMVATSYSPIKRVVTAPRSVGTTASRAVSMSVEPTEHECTIVESVQTGQSIVPPPEAVPPVLPDCHKWAGAAYGEAVAQEVPVALTQEKIVYKPVKQIVHRPVEKTTYVPKVIRKEVAEFRQVVTDEVIEVPKPYPVQTNVYVPNYVDHDKPCIISQKYIPVMGEGPTVDINCVKYEPEVHVVDIKVPKVVDGHMIVQERNTRFLAVDNISKAQWNSLVFKLNPDLCSVGDLNNLPVHRGSDGSVIAFKKEVPVGAALA